LDAAKLLGHEWGRLYFVDQRDSSLFVSKLSTGLKDPAHQRAFDNGQVVLPHKDSDSHTWSAFNVRAPLVFRWVPDARSTATDFTDHGQEVIVVRDPQCPLELEKQPGDFWLDVPLISDAGPIGKLTLQCDRTLRPERLEMLKVLSRQGTALLLACRERARKQEEKEHWIQAGFESSMSSIAHNLASARCRFTGDAGTLPVA